MFVIPSIRISEQPIRLTNNRIRFASKQQIEDYLDKNPNATIESCMGYFGIKDSKTARNILYKHDLMKKITTGRISFQQKKEKYERIRTEIRDYILKNPDMNKHQLSKIFNVSHSVVSSVFEENQND